MPETRAEVTVPNDDAGYDTDDTIPYVIDHHAADEEAKEQEVDALHNGSHLIGFS